jgi:hypothetical protein
MTDGAEKSRKQYRVGKATYRWLDVESEEAIKNKSDNVTRAGHKHTHMEKSQ